MSCALEHRRALGDTKSLFAVQLKRDGSVYDLTGKTVKFNLYDQDGNLVINEGTVTVDNAALGYASYDFVDADFIAMSADTASPLALDGEETFYGFFKVWDTADVTEEPDTYPADDNAIQIIIFNPGKSRTTPAPGVTVADIMELAKSPRRTRTVEGTVEERSIRELILADQYASGKAATSPPWGMRVAKTKPGSTVSN